MFKLELEKAKKPEIKLLTSVASSKNHKSSRKTSTSALLTTPKLLLCGSSQSVENFSRDGNTRPPNLPPEKSVWGSRTGHGTTDWSKIGKIVCQGSICEKVWLKTQHSEN